MNFIESIFELIIYRGKRMCVRCGSITKSGGWVKFRGETQWCCWDDFRQLDPIYRLSKYPKNNEGKYVIFID